MVNLDLQKVPQGNDKFRQGQNDTQLYLSAAKSEGAVFPEKNWHDKNQQTGNYQPRNIVADLVQKGSLTAHISRGKIAAAMSGDEFRRSRMAAGESLEEAFLRMERMEREVQCHA